MREILLYSATLCASDAVAALTMIKFDQSPTLFSIIFGEGIVNDAIAIILFQTVDGLLSSGEEIYWYTPFLVFLSFVQLIVFSILIGLVMGIIGALLFKHFRFMKNSPSSEILITFLLAYSSYLISDIFHYSGVISLLMSGIILQNYSWYSLSKEGKHATM